MGRREGGEKRRKREGRQAGGQFEERGRREGLGCSVPSMSSKLEFLVTVSHVVLGTICLPPHVCR